MLKASMESSPGKSFGESVEEIQAETRTTRVSPLQRIPDDCLGISVLAGGW